MPSGKEELLIRGTDGNVYIVTSTGGESKVLLSGDLIVASKIISTTADPGSPATGQVWFRTDV